MEIRNMDLIPCFRVTFSNEEGRFSLDGCADDFDWLPGVPNVPEPYIKIRHYCNKEQGETIELPEFNVSTVVREGSTVG